MEKLSDLPSSPFLTTRGAASYLLLSPKTLEALRLKGGGPPYRKHGRKVVYRLEDLEAWSQAGNRCSTSDPGSGA